MPTEPQLADSLTEALKSLKEGSGLLQEPIPPEGLSGMFSGLNLDDVSCDLFTYLSMFLADKMQFQRFTNRSKF